MKTPTKLLFLIVAVLLTASDVIRACLLLERPRAMTNVELMDRFNILVYGTYVKTEFLQYQSEGVFSVDCVLKNDDPLSPIPDEIKIRGAVPMMALCDTTKVEEGESYLLGLKRIEGEFFIDRFPLHNSAMSPSKKNLRIAGGLCSVEKVTMAAGKRVKSNKVCYLMHKISKRTKRDGLCYCPRRVTSQTNDSVRP